MITIAPLYASRKFLTHEEIARRCRRYPRVRVCVGSGKSASLEFQRVDAAGLLHFGRRAEIHGQPDRNQVAALVALLQLLPPVITKQPTCNSYSLKHTLERALGAYVTNGSLIVALDRVGIPQRAAGINSLACVSRRWLRHLSQFERGTFCALAGGPVSV